MIAANIYRMKKHIHADGSKNEQVRLYRRKNVSGIPGKYNFVPVGIMCVNCKRFTPDDEKIS